MAKMSTKLDTNPSQKSSHHTCPYAAALSDHSDDEEGSHYYASDASSPPSPRDSTTESALSLAKFKCPAFAENSCPFRGATSGDDIRSIMKNVPPSHFPSSSSALQAVVAGGSGDDEGRRESTAFQLALEHVHRVSKLLEKGGSLKVDETSSESIDRDSFTIHGGCPFKSFHKQHLSSSSSMLLRSMEEYSLAAIMGRMAESFSEGDEGDEKLESYSEEKEVHADASSKEPSPEDETQTSNPSPRDVAPSTDQSSKLSHALKVGTAESHTAAENVHFVKNFVRGVIDRELYMELVTGLYHVYVALEALLDKYGPEHFPSLHFPKELSRTESLKEDMEFWFGIGWEGICRSPSPAVKDYVDRMKEVGRTDPLLLLSHAYTRYLGDLSGGKVLARIALRALNLNGHDGLQFYNFESITSAKLFKDKYRAALDELSLEPDQIGRLVAEANVAFALNMRVFEELDVAGGVPGARVRDVREALSYYDREIEDQNCRRQGSGHTSSTKGSATEASEAKCPFAFLGGPNPHVSKLKSSADEKTEEVKSVEVTEKQKDHKSGGRCPWPFVFFHDPMMGMRDWQTWFLIGLVLCWCWAHIK